MRRGSSIPVAWLPQVPAPIRVRSASRGGPEDRIMDERSWRLPGPSAWLELAVDALPAGIVLLEAPESRRGGIEKGFERVATEAGFASSGFIRLEETQLALPPISAILEASLPPDIQPASPTPATIAG